MARFPRSGAAHGRVAKRPLRLSPALALLGVAAGWGLTVPLAKTVQQSIPTFTYLALRFGTAAILLLAIVALRRTSIAPRALVVGTGVGSVLFLGFALQALGIRLTTASRAGFITGLAVAIVPVLLAVWRRRIPRLPVVLGVCAALGGLALMTIGDLSAPLNVGDLLVFACAVCFALHMILLGRFAHAWDTVTFTTAQVIAVAILSMLAAIVERPTAAVASAPGSAWGMIPYMTLIGTIAGLWVQTWAQRSMTPTHAGLMLTFEPVVTALAGHALLGEMLVGRPALGAAAIVAGIATAELAREEDRELTERAHDGSAR